MLCYFLRNWMTKNYSPEVRLPRKLNENISHLHLLAFPTCTRLMTACGIQLAAKETRTNLIKIIPSCAPHRIAIPFQSVLNSKPGRYTFRGRHLSLNRVRAPSWLLTIVGIGIAPETELTRTDYSSAVPRWLSYRLGLRGKGRPLNWGGWWPG